MKSGKGFGGLPPSLLAQVLSRGREGMEGEGQGLRGGRYPLLLPWKRAAEDLATAKAGPQHRTEKAVPCG